MRATPFSQHEVRSRERGRVVPQQCDGEVCSKVGVDGRDNDPIQGHHEFVDDVAQQGCGRLRLIGFRPLPQP
jgi:hypothetical protein